MGTNGENRAMLRHEGIVLFVTLVALLAIAGILVLKRAFGVGLRLATVFGILPRLGEVGISTFDQRVLIAMRQLPFERRLRVLGGHLIVNGAFAKVVIVFRRTRFVHSAR